MKSILIMDNIETNRAMLKKILVEEYNVIEAESSQTALDIMFGDAKPPQAVLLDIAMSGADDFKVLRKIKENTATANIPVIFIIADGVSPYEVRGFEEGAVDYIRKPFDAPLVLARIKNNITQSVDRQRLEVLLETKTDELMKTHERTLETLAEIIECRSLESGMHIRRTKELMKAMVHRLFTSPKYRDEMDAEFCRYTIEAIALHDIGKIGIPDEILLKPGKLNPDEFEIIKQHTVIGSNIIGSIAEGAIDGIEYLKYAGEICRSHHERWDGLGYPDNLKGEDIPLSARLAAIIDVYDALVSVRCYKPACSHKDAMKIMEQGSGVQFDPDLVAEFVALSEEIASIRN